MKKLVFVFLTGLLLSFNAWNTSALATSWADIGSEEVNNRAEVIVLGQYDFTSKSRSSAFIFAGYEFTVKKIYKGEVSKVITAGIDGYDVGWADEFQQKGGEFLLFLEKSKKYDFLTPVGGPNGMVQVKDGKVQHHNIQDKAFYEKLVKTKFEKPLVKSSTVSSLNNRSHSFYTEGLVILFIGVVFFLFLWRQRKKSK
jgi:hypothetical protein